MNLEREMVYCDTERERERKNEKMHFAMLLYVCLLNSEKFPGNCHWPLSGCWSRASDLEIVMPTLGSSLEINSQ